ncbi:hypothetical protein Mapa_007562 [Marchantia paleacea]|nr:hypothetical protein Mapa_007562 [Marchantia paleacea]
MAGDDNEYGLGGEPRFTTLLYPNRDLATNWTVDVGKQLETYLAELASIGIFDDGECPLNFAEAALLIQGSIQVYSRKVEYLYALVLQALSFLGQKKQGEDDSSSSQNGDTNADREEENEEEFLNLDDIHEETNIDILDGGVSSAHSAVKIPASLLTLEADPVDMSGEAGELATYEIATSAMHRMFLLLDPCDFETVDRFLDGPNERGEKGGVPLTPGSAIPMKTPRPRVLTPCGRTGSALKRANPGTPYASEGGCGIITENEWQGDGGHGDMSWDDPNVGENREDEVLRNKSLGDAHSGAGEVDKGAQSDGYVDPWAPLNPHEPGTLPIQPFKKGVTHRKKPRLKKGRSTPTPAASRRGVCFPEFLKALQARERVERADRRHCRLEEIPSFENLRSSFRNSDAGLRADVANDQVDVFGDEPGDSELEEDNFAAPIFEDPDNVEKDTLNTPHILDRPDSPQRVSRATDNLNPNMNVPSFDDERGGEELSFEELCRTHLDSMLRKLSEAHVRTGLAGRVTKWKNKIEATLVEQDSRPPFDIHEYGDRLLEELVTIAARKDEEEEIQESFTYLVRGQEQDQVARSFSALLQLVNNGNVTIDKGELSSESYCFTGDKPFTVKLLTSQNQHEGMFKNMIPAKSKSKAPRPPQSTDRSRGKQQTFRVVHEKSSLVSNLGSPECPSGSRSSLALSISPGSVRSGRKRRQTVSSKRGNPEKENRFSSTPLHTTPVKLTPDGRYRSRRKPLSKLVQ